MALNNGDVLTLKLFSLNQNQTQLNVYWYVVSDTEVNTTEDDVGDLFVSAFIPTLRPLLATNVTINRLRIDNVTTGLTFDDRPLNLAGTNTGVGSLPPQWCGQFKLYVPTKLTRNGYKRYSGITESDVAGNAYTGVWAGAAATAHATALISPLVGTVTDHGFTASHVVVGRNSLGQPDLTRISNITAASTIPPTTQASRKIGRGV